MKISKMLPRTYPELRGSLANIVYPAWAEFKYDGEFNYFYRDSNGPTYLVNKSGKMRIGDAGPLGCTCCLVGELCYRTGNAGELYELLKHSHENGLFFRAFDILELDGVETRDRTLLERKELLKELQINTVPARTNARCLSSNDWFELDFSYGRLIESKEELDEMYQDALNANKEGIVVKNLMEPWQVGPCRWVKIKYKDRTYYQLWKINKSQDRMEVIIPKAGVSLKQSTIKDFNIVGCKVSGKAKQTLLDAYNDGLRTGNIYVEIEHQGVLGGGGLRHPQYTKNWIVK